MKRALLISALLVGACKTNTPPPAPSQAQVVFQKMVDAGCVADSDSGVSDVLLEEANDAAPAWFTCLWNGGTVASCNVPCSSSSTKK